MVTYHRHFFFFKKSETRILAITTSFQYCTEVLINVVILVKTQVIKIQKEETNFSLFIEYFKESKVYFIEFSNVVKIITEKSDGKQILKLKLV